MKAHIGNRHNERVTSKNCINNSTVQDKLNMKIKQKYSIFGEAIKQVRVLTQIKRIIVIKTSIIYNRMDMLS